MLENSVSAVQAEMPRYRCHKEVWALKIRDVICHAHPDPAVTIAEFAKTPQFQGGHLMFEDKRYAPKAFDAAWFHRHNPQSGMYYVVYKDGYESCSTAEAFGEYTLIN